MDAVEKVRLQGSFASQPRRQRRRQRRERQNTSAGLIHVSTTEATTETTTETQNTSAGLIHVSTTEATTGAPLTSGRNHPTAAPHVQPTFGRNHPTAASCLRPFVMRPFVRAVPTRPSLSLGPWIGAESDEAESDEAASDEAESDEAASDEAESEACCEQVLPNKYISELGAMVCDSD